MPGEVKRANAANLKHNSRAGYLRKNVAAELIPPTIPHKDRRFLSEDEYQRVLSDVSRVRDRAVLELFLQTGLRLSELVNLDVSDLEMPKRVTRDPENVGMIRVHRKRGKEVYLPLNWKACDPLCQRRAANDMKCRHIITPRLTWTPIWRPHESPTTARDRSSAAWIVSAI